MREPNHLRGFTLIELLVVIAIIGLLSSIVLASLNTARLKGNDAKRIGDLESMRTALELYYNGHNAYPVDAGSNSYFNGIVGPALVSDGDISQYPVDPTQGNAGNGYRYCSNTLGTAYTLIAYLQSGAHANAWCSFSTGVDACTWSSAYPIQC